MKLMLCACNEASSTRADLAGRMPTAYPAERERHEDGGSRVGGWRVLAI